MAVRSLDASDDNGTLVPGQSFDLRASLPAIIESAPDAMVIVGPDGHIHYANGQAASLFGYAASELVGQAIEVLVPMRYRAGHPQYRVEYGAAPRIRPMGTGRDLRALRKDGSEFPAEISLGPIETPWGVFVTAAVRDLTERHRLEEESRAARRAIEVADELKESLREREILLQEVHHRVKNNLQVISSLINLQRRSVHDDAARLALLECQTRVQAIGLVHEQLYKYSDYARVPFPTYVRGLVATLEVALASPGVRVAFDMAEIALAVDKAIPCGLIVNELLTNAFRHAFPHKRGGTIRIAMRRLDGPDRCELTVADDGIGFRADGAERRSLGMHLVETLVKQLGGTLQRGGGPGTSHTIRFPLEAP